MDNFIYRKSIYLDASILVKIVHTENRSQRVKEYLKGKRGVFTTSLCLAEALNVLKRLCFHEKYENKKIEEDSYWWKCMSLIEGLGGNGDIYFKIYDLDPVSDAFYLAKELAEKYNKSLDLSDCLQVVTIKYGKDEIMAGQSKPLFITADKALGEVARSEKLKVWNVIQEDRPPE